MILEYKTTGIQNRLKRIYIVFIENNRLYGVTIELFCISDS